MILKIKFSFALLCCLTAVSVLCFSFLSKNFALWTLIEATLLFIVLKCKLLLKILLTFSYFRRSTFPNIQDYEVQGRWTWSCELAWLSVHPLYLPSHERLGYLSNVLCIFHDFGNHLSWKISTWHSKHCREMVLTVPRLGWELLLLCIDGLTFQGSIHSDIHWDGHLHNIL